MNVLFVGNGINRFANIVPGWSELFSKAVNIDGFKMQKSLITVIADRYRQQDFDTLTSKDDLKPAGHQKKYCGLFERHTKWASEKLGRYNSQTTNGCCSFNSSYNEL